MEFNERLEAYRKRTERALDTWLPATDTRPARLHAAMRHAIESGGKRLRPVLLFTAADLYTPAADPAPAAAAVEMLHTYSLVHDDLPAMDDSPLRRGNPTVHIAFDEATAVLTGDALLTEAFFVLARAYATRPEIAAVLARHLGEAANSRHLIGGQAADTLAEHTEITPEDLDFIHLNKTAALIGAALSMGLALTDAPASSHEPMRRIGRALGLAFQIVDDLLDATGDEAVVGKPLRSDAERAKNTYPRLHGIPASRKRVRQLTKEALAQTAKLDADTAFLESLIQHLEKRIA
ncbi:MAG: polyprenyl synthetase family protein [Opitutales bacterium]|nr:polyprenyl synthetase family protein [Opitutales bacterium]